MSFLPIPSGKFFMGCVDNDKTCHHNEKLKIDGSSKYNFEVQITKNFYMAKYETTQKQWQEITGSNPAKNQKCGEDCPIENVSWEEIQEEFINKLCIKEKDIWNECPYRLPTEAEWEYAARGDSTTAYTWGNDFNTEIVWYKGNSESKTHPVGKKNNKNKFGLYDMLGNVSEYCSDYFHPDTYNNLWEKAKRVTPIIDPKVVDETTDYRIVRGGSIEDEPNLLTVSTRFSQKYKHKEDHIGFRLVLQVK